MNKTLTLDEHEIDIIIETLFFKHKRISKMFKNEPKLINTTFGVRQANEAIELDNLIKKIIKERQ